MSETANISFQVKSWEEDPYRQMDDGTKLTRAQVVNAFQGDIEGEGTVEYLMFHRADGTATFVGLEHFAGRIGDRTGTFVLEHRGTFNAGQVDDHWSVVPGSGTGDLEGLQGEADFASQHAEEYPMTFRYGFE
jgi:hypothetical protein